MASYWSVASFTPQTRPSPTEKVTKETQKSTSTADGNIPNASIGNPVAAVLGRKRVPDSNTLWTGNLRPLTETVTETETVSDTNDGTTTVTETTTTTTAVVGYLIDIHMGICLGPDVKLIGIYVDKLRVWSGEVGPGRTEFDIGENETFLSGVSCVFSGGAIDQEPEPLVQVPDYPGYVGVATCLMLNVRADLPMGQLSFEVVREPNPLSLSSGVNRVGDDINLASALVEIITNPWGYAGLDISDVDTTKFVEVAGQLADEGNYCSVKISAETSVAAVVKSIQDQGSLVVFQHPETMKISCQLVRMDDIDYVAKDSRFYMHNIKELRSYNKTGWQDAIDQARGFYTERDADYNDLPVFAQSGVVANMSGRGKKTASFQYPFVANKELAAALTARDLAIYSAPLVNFDLLTNRDGAGKLPGDTAVVSWDPYRILNMPVVISKVRKHPIDQNTVSLSVKQLKMPDAGIIYEPSDPPVDPGFDVDPVAPVSAKIISAPYSWVRKAWGTYYEDKFPTTPMVAAYIMPRAANDLQASFKTDYTNINWLESVATAANVAPYPTFAKLVGAIDQMDGFDDGIMDSITIDTVVRPSNLIDGGIEAVKKGLVSIVVGNEIMSFEGVTDNGDGTWTLHEVHRALVDTVFEAHADDAEVYIINNNFNALTPPGEFPFGTRFIGGSGPNFRIYSNALTKDGSQPAHALDVNDAFDSPAQRILRPPRPHDTKVEGSRGVTPVELLSGVNFEVTWKTRTRKNLDVATMADPAETPEPGQVHRIFLRYPGGVTIELGSGPYAGNSATVSLPGGYNGPATIYVQAEMVIGGVTYTSLYQDRVPIISSEP